MTRCEITSPDLARELPACPTCGTMPTIYSLRQNFRFSVAVICVDCHKLWHGTDTRIMPANVQWHPTLFDAVNQWVLVLKLVGGYDDSILEMRIGRSKPDIKTRGESYIHHDGKGVCIAYIKHGNEWYSKPPF